MEKIIHFSIKNNPHFTELKNIDIARKLNPNWEVMVWQDPVKNDDFKLKHYHRFVNSGAQLADLIRLDVIYKFGGIYLDSDVVLNKSLDELSSLDHFFCSENGHILTNAVFGASKNNKMVGILINYLLNNEPNWSLPPNITTGPEFFSKMLRWEHGLILLPRDSFFPYGWNEKPMGPLVTSFGVHEWNSSWKKFGFLEKLKSSVKRTISCRFQKLNTFTRRFINKLGSLLSFTSHYSYGDDIVVRTNRNIFMYLDGNDLTVTPEIALRGTYEESELRFLEESLKGGDFFIDVGCNVGIFSLLAARNVGPFGRVFAIDANSDVLKNLTKSLVMNWMQERVVKYNNAVGAENGKVEFSISKEVLGGSRLVGEDNGSYNKLINELGHSVNIKVDMITLDDLFPVSLEYKILKIDVEGFEYLVLNGAKNLLTNKSFKYIMMEVAEEVGGSNQRVNVDAVLELVKSGYRIGYADGRGKWTQCDSLYSVLKYTRNIILCRDN
jgi:FkbM family methyltransferase